MRYHFDETALGISFGVLAFLLVILVLKKRSFSYILFFSIFAIYIINVISLVIFPISIPDPSLMEQTNLWRNINLIPFYFGDCHLEEICQRQIIENIILTIPFGFGICFIVRLKARDFIWLPWAVGLGFEISQFVISQGGFHALDINDVILNAAGVGIGYACFKVFGWMYRGVINFLKVNPRWLFAYVYDVVR